MPSAFSWPVWASLLANIALFSVKLACFLRAKSLAVAASLLDSTLDLLAQCLLAVAATLGERPDPRFPVGARRLEAAAVIVVAAVFAVGAGEVATECVLRLARGSSAPTPRLTRTDLALLSGVVAAKLALFAACVAFIRGERRAERLVSPSIKALAADHAADALTNGVALLAALGAAAASLAERGERKKLAALARLADPVGGLLIAVAVFAGWGVQAWDHVSKLVGKRASRETREKIREKVEERRRACASAGAETLESAAEAGVGDGPFGDVGEIDPRVARRESSPPRTRRFLFEVDSIRAYHGGERVVVEVEVVMAPETTLRESHDVCLLLQQDLETMDEVERAFVHADYAKRAAPEHAGDLIRRQKTQNTERRASLCRRAPRWCRVIFFLRRRVPDSRDVAEGRAFGDVAETRERRPRPEDGHRRLGSNVALTCEEGEGPAFDTIREPLLPER